MIAATAVAVLLHLAAVVAQGGCDPVCGADDVCVGDKLGSLALDAQFHVCSPTAAAPPAALGELVPSTSGDGPARIVVVSNIYVGCNAGRREANVFSYAAKQISDRYPNVVFLTSLKGGTTSQCRDWAEKYESIDKWGGGIVAAVESDQPLTIDDQDSAMRDHLFLPPYPHPSYIVIDFHGVVRNKFVGPCCGEEGYFDCTDEKAITLNETLHSMILPLTEELQGLYPNNSSDCLYSAWSEWSACDCGGGSDAAAQVQARNRTVAQREFGSGTCDFSLSETRACFGDAGQCPRDCEQGEWGEWSACSAVCGGGGTRYRTRSTTTAPLLGGAACGPSLQRSACAGEEELAPCPERCVPAVGGAGAATRVVASAAQGDWLRSPRDLEFSTHPGRHLGSLSGGRPIPTEGEELWVANGRGHAFTILSACDTPEQTATSRGDRGYYHYMSNVSALSFNRVQGREGSFNTHGYVATCQDNRNTYLNTKNGNNFQGPTLYNTDPQYKNLVSRDGSPCTSGADECFLLHSDMLHESPECPGIVHDPENTTAYGTVFWAIDGMRGHLVRYDFQQPHFAGFMDHSIAAVRRYPEILVQRGPPGLHHGMAVDPSTRTLYVASPGAGEVLWVKMDSGQYARTAREEYPPFSNRLPSFEYSIIECAEWGVFASLQGQDAMPSGLAIDGENALLYVGRYESSELETYDLHSGALIASHSVRGQPQAGLSGLTLSPATGRLFAADDLADEVLTVDPDAACAYVPVANPDYAEPPPGLSEGGGEEAGAGEEETVWVADATRRAVFSACELEQDAAIFDAVSCGAKCDTLDQCWGYNLNDCDDCNGKGCYFVTDACADSLVDSTNHVRVYSRQPAAPSAPTVAPTAACSPEGTIPNASLFEQVHVVTTGYGSDDEAVQNDDMMDESAALLADRTDCEPGSELNFDALLLGGYYCHTCLPDPCVPLGGRCENIAWLGYSCDNELHVRERPCDDGSSGMMGCFSVGRCENCAAEEMGAGGEAPELVLEYGKTYRFVVHGGVGGGVRVLDRRGDGVTGVVTTGVLELSVVAAGGGSEGWATLPAVLAGAGGFALPFNVSDLPPTSAPTSSPSSDPSAAPSSSPTTSPTAQPSDQPSPAPSSPPTEAPTAMPSAASTAPTSLPTQSPATSEEVAATGGPSAAPTPSPSSTPVEEVGPSLSESPTGAPVAAATGGTDTKAPTKAPTPATSSAPSQPPLIVAQDDPSAPAGRPTASLFYVGLLLASVCLM